MKGGSYVINEAATAWNSKANPVVKPARYAPSLAHSAAKLNTSAQTAKNKAMRKKANITRLK